MQHISAKGYTLSCYEVVFVIKKVKNTVHWIYVISDLKWEQIVKTLYEKEFRIEK